MGSSATQDGVRHAFLYSHGTIEDLGTRGGRASVATVIDNRNVIVGWATRREKGNESAFLYVNGQMQDLNETTVLPWNWRLSVAWDINDTGEIVGKPMVDGQRRASLRQPVR